MCPVQKDFRERDTMSFTRLKFAHMHETRHNTYGYVCDRK